MSDWNLICQKGWWKYIADNCYTSPYFPIEVRGLLASWLEASGRECIWQFDELTHQPYIYGFLKNMVEELVRRSNALPTSTEYEYFYKCRMDDIVRQMQNLMLTNQLEIFTHMKHNLSNEKREISRLQNGNSAGTSVGAPTISQSYGVSTPQKSFAELNTEIIDIIQQITAAVKTADNFAQECNAYFSNLQTEKSDFTTQLNQLQQQAGQNGVDFRNSYGFQVITEKLTRIDGELSNASGKVNEVYSQVVQIIPNLERVYATVSEELNKFTKDQRFIILGQKSDRDLDKIDKWYGDIVECLDGLQHSLRVLMDMGKTFCFDIVNNVQTEIQKIGSLRRNMISSCPVFETQPKQIIRTKTKFGPVKLRLLSCSKNMMVDGSSITVTLINDVQASELPESKILNENYVPPNPIGKLVYATKDYPRVTSNHVYFKDFKVLEPTRGTTKGKKNVTEEQFFIFVQVTVNIEGTLYKLWTMTLPIIITTHPTQEDAAYATLLWDNCLPNNKRLPFSQVPVPQDVSWPCLLELIDLLFLKRGKRLSEENKAYLKNKVFRGKIPANDMITYNLFCKDEFVTVNIKLLSTKKTVVKSEIVAGNDGEPAKIFTFWMWVCSFLELLDWTPEDPKLMHCSLKDLWIDNKIVGFISEDEVKNKLNTASVQYPNTSPFLLRFPEGRPESIGIYFYGATAHGPITLLKFTYLEEDLDKLSLHRRIIQNYLISHLHPNIEKEEAFTKVERASMINEYFIVGVKEYWSSAQFQSLQLQNTISDQGGDTSNPSTSSRSHSYRSYQNHSSHSQAPSPAASAQSENSDPCFGAFGGASPGSCSTTNLTTDQLANHQMMETSEFGFGISNWIQDGVATSSLIF